MIRAALLLAVVAAPAAAQEGTLRDRFQSVTPRTAAGQIPERFREGPLCDAASLSTLSEGDWLGMVQFDVEGFSGMLGLLRTVDPDDGDLSIGPKQADGTRSYAFASLPEVVRSLKPMAFAELDLELQIDRGRTLGYLLGDLGFETIAGCPIAQLPIFEVYDGAAPATGTRIGVLVFVTKRLGYQLIGALPRTDGVADRSYASGILMR